MVDPFELKEVELVDINIYTDEELALLQLLTKRITVNLEDIFTEGDINEGLRSFIAIIA